MENIKSENDLKQFIATHDFNSKQGYYIKDIFQMFMDVKVNNLQSFLSAPDDFCDFCSRNIKLFNNKETNIQVEKIVHLIYSYAEELKRFISTDAMENNRSYVNIVKSIVPFRSAKVLDVGAGRVPFSSIMLSEFYNKVQSLDCLYYPSVSTLQKLGIEALVGKFGYNSSLDGVDFVVGKTPCSAIAPIAKVCGEQGVPYLIETCECEVPRIVFDENKPCFGWEDVLPNLDSGVKFYKGFAFHTHLSEDEVCSKINTNLFGARVKPTKIDFKPFVNLNNTQSKKIQPKEVLFEESVPQF